MNDKRIYVGSVTEGSKKASALGFPTINIPLTDGMRSGIYAGKVMFEGTTYVAAVYADPRRRVLEAHLINFPGGIATGTVTIELGTKIREDRTFDDDEALRLAIADDIEQVRALSME